MAVLLRALRALFPLLRLQPWLLSAMIILGVLAALSEGLSISLFIPLVQDQIGTQTVGAAGRFAELFQWIPSQHRLLWIGISIARREAACLKSEAPCRTNSDPKK